MKCPNCGLHVLSTSRFCKHCGIEVSSFDKKETTTTSYTTNHNSYHYPKKKKFNIPYGFVVIIVLILFGLWGSSHTTSSNVTTAGVENPAPPACADPSPGQTYNSLPNGTEIDNNSGNFNGQGDLTIKNGSQDDAVAKIIDTTSNTSIGEFYIDANNDYTISGVPDGTYSLLFSLGKNWDSANDKFITCKVYSKFEDTFEYTTTDTQATTYNVTLNPVVGGTAQTTSVNESDFEKY